MHLKPLVRVYIYILTITCMIRLPEYSTQHAMSQPRRVTIRDGESSGRRARKEHGLETRSRALVCFFLCVFYLY